MKIREIAREHKIAQVASPALARAIYHTTKLEQEIPDGLFMAVAQILAYVYQLQAFHRITSYNVCYTKLLRCNWNSSRRVARRP